MAMRWENGRNEPFLQVTNNNRFERLIWRQIGVYSVSLRDAKTEISV